MQFNPTKLAGVLLVTVAPHIDGRGLFARTFDAAEFAAAGLPITWPQCNTSWNAKRGTLRGMHFQAPPCLDGKLVRCVRGCIFDVVIDLRQDSPTFHQCVGLELADHRRDAHYIPAGYAHGFLTLDDNCEVLYMMSASYVPELACGVRWNDPAFAIAWPFEPTVISQRDATWPNYTSS